MLKKIRKSLLIYAIFTIGLAILLRLLLDSSHNTSIVIEKYCVIGYWLIIAFLACSYYIRYIRKHKKEDKEELFYKRIFLIWINGLAGGIIFGNLEPFHPERTVWNFRGIFFGGLIAGAITAIAMLISEKISDKKYDNWN